MPEQTRPHQMQPQQSPENANDVFPDFAVSLEETARRVKMLQQYVREHMAEGEDYGIIPGSTKPTLFKPGAEKLNSVFGLAPMVEVTVRHEDYEKGFVNYEIKVTLINKRTGQVEAEGLGSCNSKERRYARQDAAGIANTVLKMAKKRALIDATLSATRASGLFTQDLEDMHESTARGSEARGGEARSSVRGDLLTEAQHRGILAVAGRVFGRPATAEDFRHMRIEKPIEELTKSEASKLIDRLRLRLADGQGSTGQGNTGQAPTRQNTAQQSTPQASSRPSPPRRARNADAEPYHRSTYDRSHDRNAYDRNAYNRNAYTTGAAGR